MSVSENPGLLPPPPEPPDRPKSRRHTVLAVVLSVIGVLMVTVVLAGFLIHLPYVIISPGSSCLRAMDWKKRNSAGSPVTSPNSRLPAPAHSREAPLARFSSRRSAWTTILPDVVTFS